MGPSVDAGNQNYDLTSNRPRDTGADSDSYLTPSQLLFPGGPAAAHHSRAQQSFHALLCGVDLPPVDAHCFRICFPIMVPGDGSSRSFTGGYLVSTSNGNAIRLNRVGPFTDISETRTSSANDLVGWTNDGLPSEGTVGGFSTAFVRALGESSLLLPVNVEPDVSASATVQATEKTGATAAQSKQADDVHAQLLDSDEEDMGENPPSSPEDLKMHDPSSESDPLTGNEAQPAESNDDLSSDEAPPEGVNVPGSPPSDGDSVTSSLAVGLKLSPRSVPTNS